MKICFTLKCSLPLVASATETSRRRSFYFSLVPMFLSFFFDRVTWVSLINVLLFRHPSSALSTDAWCEHTIDFFFPVDPQGERCGLPTQFPNDCLPEPLLIMQTIIESPRASCRKCPWSLKSLQVTVIYCCVCIQEKKLSGEPRAPQWSA